MLDSHCHVNQLVYESDEEVDQVIERAKMAGVDTLITIGSGYGVAATTAAVYTAHRHSNVFASVGIHPHDASEWNDEVHRELHRLSADPKVVAIGEMGLDFYYKRSPREQQRMVFRQQIQLAKETNLPIIIHDRESNGETFDILCEEQAFGIRNYKSSISSNDDNIIIFIYFSSTRTSASF